MNKVEFMKLLEARWQELTASTDGLEPYQMLIPGVVGTWSVKDILGHVTSWEQETLSTLPEILAGKPAPVYSQIYGSIDTFNAYMVMARNRQTLEEILANLEKVHGRLLRFLEEADPTQFLEETPFLIRLSMDTTEHYPEHAEAIRAWRARRGL
ncbi:MAG: DinB family protein [Chloroflexi bacterium]|jgi:hypothetical protein|nr:DinB family protein [Chloroflexota bacterium]HOG77183.1 DinB family protein [Anaerolineaceae bacterium]